MAERAAGSGFAERALLQIERAPWHALYRAATGFLILALGERLGSADDWRVLLLVFGAVLLGLRIVPGVARRVLPFSPAAHALWAEQRRLAKRYDAYQWRKLAWIGAGMLGWLSLPGHFDVPAAVLGSACIVGGALGALLWNRRLAAASRRGATQWGVIERPPRGA